MTEILQPLNSLEPFFSYSLEAIQKEKGMYGELRSLMGIFLDHLEKGQLRAAQKNVRGEWEVDPRIKQGILLAFRLGNLVSMGGESFSFVDKDLLPLQHFSVERGVRLVPGGLSVRRGACLEKGVVMMPPSYVNVGAYVGEGTLIDSHALVGSCAQVGKRVHLSAAAQLGGVLEPIGALPVIVEDDVFIGGNCGIYEGAIIRTKAVIGAGVILTSGTPVYDLPRRCMMRAAPGKPLEIPSGAVVIPGSRPIEDDFAKMHGLCMNTPVIVKYRDEKTDSKSALETALR